MKRALITGGAGFLGSHLAESLVEDGYSVTVLDNLMSGFEKNLINIKDKVKFINHDVIDPYDIAADEYWNLACCASPPKYQKDPIHTFKTSIWGIENALKNATKYGGVVFQASTSEIYGDPTVSVQTEDYWGNVNPIGIRATYDEGKRGAETLMTDWARQYGTNIRIARIFNTYGERLDMSPGSGDGRVISNFISQAISGTPITIYGDGSQTRSFCYITDLISGFRKLIDSNETTPVNLGNPNEFTILELANTIKELTNSKSEIQFLALPSDDPKQRKPSIEKARRILGWGPKVQLAAGLNKMIDYYIKTY